MHFNNAMNDFYEDSIPQERIDFLNFAVKMVKADKKITNEENKPVCICRLTTMII